MSTITIAATDVRVVDDSRCTFFNARCSTTGSLAVGVLVYWQSASAVYKASASAAACSNCIGMVYGASGQPGDMLTILAEGPVNVGSGIAGSLSGTKLWLSDTAGRVDTASGTLARPLGTIFPAANGNNERVWWLRTLDQDNGV